MGTSKAAEVGKLLLEKKELLALNVYLAMCYHRLDYYDVSQEVLASYVQTHLDSTIAINLKACNYYRLFNGKAAEAELKGLQVASSPSFQFAKDLIRHNLVFIMNRKPEHAWELYLKMETSADSFSLLQVMANDCYKMEQFYYAAKAFDVLEKLDPNPEYWEGKRGACIGQFQLVVAGRESRDTLRDIIQILQDTANSQAELIAVAIRKWAKDKKVPLAGQPRHQLTNM